MKTKKETLNPVEIYQFDAVISNEIYITLDKDKIDMNCNNFIDYTVNAVEIEYSNYCFAVYEIGKNTILTIMEGKGSLYSPKYELITNSQFLFTSEDIRGSIKTKDLTQFVNPEVANLIIGYFYY